MAVGIKEILIKETSRIPSSVLKDVQFYLDEEEDRIDVIADVSTPAILTPTQVSNIQDQLTKHIGKPIELIMHCALSSNVSALGSVKNNIEQSLDGAFVKSKGNDTFKDIATTEQIIREHFTSDNALDLGRVEHVAFDQRRLMLAHVAGFRRMEPAEIDQLQLEIRKATGDNSIELVISQMDKTISTHEGTFRYGWFLGKKGTPENKERARQIRAELIAYFARDKAYALVNSNVTHLDDKFHFLLEIVGTEVYPLKNIERLQALLVQKYKEPIALYAWSRIEVVQGPQEAISMKELNAYFSGRQKENLPEILPLILEASRK